MSSRGKIDDRTDALLSEYAIGALPFDERANLEAQLKRDDALQARLDWWQTQLTDLSDEVEPVTPPAGALQQIETRLFTSSAAKASWWENIQFWRGLSATAAAGLIMVAALFATYLREPAATSPNLLVAQLSGEAADLKVTAAYDPDSRTIRVNRTAGRVPTGRDLELWVIAGDNPPISIGLLPPEPNGQIMVAEPVQARIGPNVVLAISDEPIGGSPTGQPTGTVLVTGFVTEI